MRGKAGAVLLACAALLALAVATWIFQRRAPTLPDPAATAAYAWPADLAFDAPVDLPHNNNYPAFTRVGARGVARWQAGQLQVTLSEITHAPQRNVWFDCRDLQQVRVGLTRDGPFGDSGSVEQPAGAWSAWEAVGAVRPARQALAVRGTWTFQIPAASEAWRMRLAVQARCTNRDNASSTVERYSGAWFLARAAHAQARAPDPCALPMRLRDAIAAQCGQAAIARLATSWGRREVAAPPSQEAGWLDLAIAEGLPQLLRPLVQAGVDVNAATGDNRETALIYAGGNGDAESVRQLLMLGARREQADAKGYTAYNAAAVSGYGDLALELAEQGVARDAATGPAYTALALAAYHGEHLTVRRLLESGSDPDRQVNGWYNALHHAVKKNDVELARTMLAGGANPNLPVSARRGETPLMMAAENGNIELMVLLRRMGARLDLLDKHGKNAADYALFFHQPPALAYLCEAGLRATDNPARC